jgi:hypothetical protein
VTQVQTLANVINWGINVAFVIPALFPLAIRPIWAWTKSSMGWNVIALDFVVALALLPTWLHRTFDVNSFTIAFLYVQALSIWLVPTVVIWRTCIIWSEQRHIRKENGNAIPRPERVSDDS